MKEILIPVSFNSVDFFGVNDVHLELLRKKFPLLKIAARGNEIKVLGDEQQVTLFEALIKELIVHFEKTGHLEPDYINELLEGNGESADEDHAKKFGDVIVFGQQGIMVKARTAGQKRLVECCMKNDITFAIGPAGTGKTYTAVALAVRALKNKEIKRIILTRPAVEAGENLGFLPGDLKEKIDPYLRPLYDALFDMIPADKLASFIANGIIEVAPLAFMRGRTLDNAYVILDEAQNATQSQLKMFLTRMGPSAKLILTGDVTQIDLPKSQPSGLIQGLALLNGIKGIGIVLLDARDVVRHKLVKDIIEAYSNGENKKPT
ncbi:MAG: PhoH family protein [Bacteroidetes bacterium]|nr:PhoH family protein [Bacteroidota bacterium]